MKLMHVVTVATKSLGKSMMQLLNVAHFGGNVGLVEGNDHMFDLFPTHFYGLLVARVLPVWRGLNTDGGAFPKRAPSLNVYRRPLRAQPSQ